MNETIPGLSIEADGDEILIQQDLGGNTHYVTLHRIHVRLMAERLGLVATSDVQAARRIEALSRRLWVLGSRIETLADYLRNCSDHDHADLSWEMTYCNATRDIADEFVADLDDMSPEPETQPATAPATPATVTRPARVDDASTHRDRREAKRPENGTGTENGTLCDREVIAGAQLELAA